MSSAIQTLYTFVDSAEAGRVDEVWIHLVPVLLGSGKRLVDDLGGRQVRLKHLETIQSQYATHLRYRVIRD